MRRSDKNLNIIFSDLQSDCREPCVIFKSNANFDHGNNAYGP